MHAIEDLKPNTTVTLRIGTGRDAERVEATLLSRTGNPAKPETGRATFRVGAADSLDSFELDLVRSKGRWIAAGEQDLPVLCVS